MLPQVVHHETAAGDDLQAIGADPFECALYQLQTIRALIVGYVGHGKSAERSVLQRVAQHAPDRPRSAVHGAANIVDLPVAAVTDEIITDRRVGGIGAGSVVADDGDGDN